MSDVTMMTMMTMMMMVMENIADTTTKVGEITDNCIALICVAVFLFRQIVRTNVIH